MTSGYNESSQNFINRLDVTYEELLFYEEHHLIGKRVRLLRPIGSLLRMLNLHGSFCSERL